jgi:hypothetical protein
MKFKNKKRTYKGIKFKSNLEVAAYKFLEQSKLDFCYECEKHIIVPGFVYEKDSYEKIGSKKKVYKLQRQKVQPITYTPDFIVTKGKKRWIIETKGLRTPAFNIKWKLFKKYLIENNAQEDLFMPTNQREIKETIALIKQS